ncbi:hypothetical protein AAMO2058_000790000 [Amorphochlora amoebiformis]
MVTSFVAALLLAGVPVGTSKGIHTKPHAHGTHIFAESAEYCTSKHRKGVTVFALSNQSEKYCIQGSRCCVTSSRRGDSDLVFKSHGCWLDMLRLDYNGRSIVLNKMDGEETFMRGNLNVTELMDIKVKDLNHVTFCTSKNRQKYGKRPPMEETGSSINNFVVLTFKIPCKKFTNIDLVDIGALISTQIREFFNNNIANKKLGIPALGTCDYSVRTECPPSKLLIADVIFSDVNAANCFSMAADGKFSIFGNTAQVSKVTSIPSGIGRL